MGRRRTSYAWALHTDLSRRSNRQLSENAAKGLPYAQELAQAARARSRQNLRRDPAFTPLTIAALAARDQIAASTIRNRINTARRELFDDLTDASIYKRRQRQNQPNPRRFKRCQHKACTDHLPANAHGNQRYCSRHNSARERVHRHRQAKARGPAGQKRP